MRIGNHELESGEAEWTRIRAKEILTEATKSISQSLNLQCSEEDVAGLLQFLWAKSPAQVSNDEAEAAEIESSIKEDEVAEAEADETDE